MMKVSDNFCAALLAAAILIVTSCTANKEEAQKTPRAVRLSETELSLNVGENHLLKATVLPEEAADKSVSWSSTKEECAAVDKNGLVTAKAVGNAYIIAETVNGIKESCLVKVTVEKGGSKDSSGEIYIEEPVIW